MSHRSAYPSPIMPMDAHDLAFEAFRDRVKAERNLSLQLRSRPDPSSEKPRAGVHPDRQPLFIRRLMRVFWRLP